VSVGWVIGNAAKTPRSRLRHAKGISQEDLAHEAGINRSYMSKLEKGASYPGLEIIAKLAAVLEVEPAELLRSVVMKFVVITLVRVPQ
jgi:transcriptional regulator with XRE-family HTH domain